MGAAGSGVQPRKYGGKELDRENGLDWYDSQARHYDPTTGRTPTMDSKAESYYSLSPYLWCAGNPVRNIDPTGMYFDQATTNQAGLYIEQLNERIAELNHSNAEDRAEQLAEVARSLQDIEDMRNDEKRRYIFVSVVGVPETIQLADGSIQMNIDENMPGNYAHEIKHGGQIARNEFGYTNGHPDERYGASHEVNAYKAQLSSCGQISYMPNYDFDANPNISLKIALLGQKSAWITVSNIKDISTTFLKSIYEGPGVHIWQLYSEKRYGKEWFEK
jgi:RHS repeat-associated protein